MPWANFDDKFPKHPKVLPLSDAAFRLHVSAVCYAAEHLTNGSLSVEVVPLLVPRYKKAALTELLTRGRWHEPERGCGTETCPYGEPDCYQLHDYLEWNRSREAVESERERKRKAGRKGAESRWGA